MNVAADRTDLRVAVPVAIGWVVAAVLVGQLDVAWSVVAGSTAGGTAVRRWWGRLDSDAVMTTTSLTAAASRVRIGTSCVAALESK